MSCIEKDRWSDIEVARSKEWSSFLNDDHKINNTTTTTFAVSRVALSEGIGSYIMSL
jgi:hypothetical protein